MIEFLRLKNFAIFDLLELEFSKGLNVITGESGSGKSLILKGIDLVFGGKVLDVFFRSKKDALIVEAVIYDGNEEMVLKREVSPATRKSRFYLNDSMVTQKKIKEIREKFLLYAAQDAQRVLSNDMFFTKILDSQGLGNLVKEKRSILKELGSVNSEIKELKKKIKELKEKKEFWEFQIREIDRINPKPGEEEELEDRRKMLKSQEEIQTYVQRSLEILESDSGLQHLIFDLQRCLERISKRDESIDHFLEEIENFSVIIEELRQKLLNYPVFLDVEQELEKIEERLWKLAQIKKRFNKSLEEIVKLKKETQKELSRLEYYELLLEDLLNKQNALISQLKNVVFKISQKREKEAIKVSKFLKKELIELGFSKEIEINFDFEEKSIFENKVLEKIPKAFWRPNPGLSPMPFKEIASGGEVSRLFLALMLLNLSDVSTTLIFDEIESGIGGITLSKMCEKIKKLSKCYQVILVSHWPLMASLADRHIAVEKREINGETMSMCKILRDEEVIEELSRMAGGGEKGMVLALKLIEEKSRYE